MRDDRQVAKDLVTAWQKQCLPIPALLVTDIAAALAAARVEQCEADIEALKSFMVGRPAGWWLNTPQKDVYSAAINDAVKRLQAIAQALRGRT